MPQINSLVEEVHRNALDHGWHDDKVNFGEQIALIHNEASKALEEYRNHAPFDQTGRIDDKPTGIPIKMADIVIRVMDLCGYYGIDLEQAIERKMAYNKTRPYRHGGKRV